MKLLRPTPPVEGQDPTTPAPAPPPLGAPGPVAAAAAPPAQAADDAPAREAHQGNGAGADGPPPPRPRRPRRPVPKDRWDLPAWGVSILVHAGVLGLMAAAGLTPEVRRAAADLNTALIDTRAQGAERELTPILSDPSDMPREEAVGTAMPTLSQGLGSGVGAPSATPRLGVGRGIGAVNERTSLPGIQVVPRVSGLSMLPSAPIKDLGGRGMIAGDVTYEVRDVGAALDQLAREILRHLEAHKLTVVWLFDESGSMKDDQKAIKAKFARVADELKVNQDSYKKSADALTHAIVGFGKEIHFEIERPTLDIDAIGRAIDRLRVDETGVENTLHAIREVIARYGPLIGKERRVLIVLVTDESGDDGPFLEEARQVAVNRGVPIYVVGRQAMFGSDTARLLYVDPVTNDQYWPPIRRGPEAAGIENLQWDGLHERRDEQPSGLAPYELARLAKDTGGIYFLLPSEEEMRLRHRERAYSIETMKEYVPDYESRAAYAARLEKSELRRSLSQVIAATRPGQSADSPFSVRIRFPIEPVPLVEAAMAAGNAATVRLNTLVEVEKQLRALKRYRDREPEKRWQAHYDLMLAQVVAYQVKAFEYRALMKEIVEQVGSGKVPKPKSQPKEDQVVIWDVDHSTKPRAPKEETEKKYAEARRLLELVIERHPKTPWADLAQDELNRGMSVQMNEWLHSTRYEERQKLVPKY